MRKYILIIVLMGCAVHFYGQEQMPLKIIDDPVIPPEEVSIPPELIAGCATSELEIPPIQNPPPGSTCSTFEIGLNKERDFDVIFMPQPNSQTTSVHLNFIFVQREDGSGNFQENNSEHQELFDEIIEIMESKFSSIVNSTEPSCNPTPEAYDFIPDSKIRFTVDKIYIRDSYG